MQSEDQVVGNDFEADERRLAKPAEIKSTERVFLRNGVRSGKFVT